MDVPQKGVQYAFLLLQVFPILELTDVTLECHTGDSFPRHHGILEQGVENIVGSEMVEKKADDVVAGDRIFLEQPGGDIGYLNYRSQPHLFSQKNSPEGFSHFLCLFHIHPFDQIPSHSFRQKIGSTFRWKIAFVENIANLADPFPVDLPYQCD